MNVTSFLTGELVDTYNIIKVVKRLITVSRVYHRLVKDEVSTPYIERPNVVLDSLRRLPCVHFYNLPRLSQDINYMLSKELSTTYTTGTINPLQQLPLIKGSILIVNVEIIKVTIDCYISFFKPKTKILCTFLRFIVG